MKSCYDYALEYISRYPKTEQELRIKLYQRGYSSDDVDQTMKKLKEKKYVDDKLFAEMYVRSDIIKKGKPALLLKKKLEMKGVDKKIIHEVFDDNGSDMQEGIEQRIKKEIEQYKKKGIDGFDIIQKLLRKGYKLHDIKHVITSGKT